MANIILDQIKKFIKSMNETDSLKTLRKTTFAEGYKVALDAISDIIEMGENFQKERKDKDG